MMSSERPSYSRLATDALAQAPVELEPAAREVDAAAIAAIAEAIRQTHAQRKRRRVAWIAGGLALAASVAFAVGWSRHGHDAAPIASPAKTAAEPVARANPANAAPETALAQAPATTAPEAPTAEATAPAPKQGPAPVRPKQDVAAGNAPSTTAPAALAASDLAQQNAILARAASARRAGDRRGALAAYEEFLARYPSSTQAETAEVERMRVIASMDPARGKVAADEYLRRHPKGYAREEARILAGAASP